MSDLRRPLLTVHVVLHPDSGHDDIADALRQHFNRERIAGVGNRMGVGTVYSRGAPVDFDGSETNAVVILGGDEVAGDERWRAYVNEINAAAATDHLRRRVLPVAVTHDGLRAFPDVQALRLDRWKGTAARRRARLTFELTHELAVMLTAYHDHLLDRERAHASLVAAQPVCVFLSHSKHDNVGSGAAEKVRRWLHRNSRLASFLDVVDIPAGHSFADVLEDKVKRSAVLAIHTDTYSSRAWCQKEVLLAKEKGVPVVVASCLERGDERCFPYLANTPVVPLSTTKSASIRGLVGRLLDEVLRWVLWRCRTRTLRERTADVLFIPRPPELLTYAHLKREGALPSLVVYAGPELGIHERALLDGVGLTVRSFDEWLAERADEEQG